MSTISATEFLTRAAQSYSMYVCQERAIPKVTDGLKSVQRIAAWVMRSRGKTKVSALSGAMIESNLYVHGMADGAISGLAGPFVNNVPLLEGDGNFGSLMAPTSFGAGRYTYVLKSKYLEDVMYADKELYNMIPSVDGDNEICETFLPLIPHVLLNGVSGIAVGWSTEILPHDPNDLVAAVRARLEGKTPKKLKPSFNAYKDIVIEEIDNGREDAASYQLTGKVEIKNTSTVEIISLPPGITIEKLQETLDKLEEDKKIVSYENYTAADVKVIVKLSRSELAKHTELSLAKLFKITTRITQRLVTVDFTGDKIRVFNNTDELIDAWVDWRFPFFKKRYETRAAVLLGECNFLKAIIELHEKEFPAQITNFKSKTEMMSAIKSIVTVSLSEEEISKIASLPSYRWVREELAKTKSLLSEKEGLYSHNIEIAESEDLQKKEWISELKSLKF
uniref:DNA topoisomerase (ATP-hydrolyzing) n=1 Tax=Ochrobactrum phage ORM_20 TaxID=2985243 RepID=A0A9N6WVB6_9VIRU|nr:DNA topoisomerase II [Ochrobactrum phage ORM_20]